MSSIKLIVGLGNPGQQYEFTRHNIGANWVIALAARFDMRFTTETKFQGRLGQGSVFDSKIRLLLPSTYMNSSGDSVASVARYFQYAAEEILVVHDELAFDVGTVRLKRGGGSNGHNGIKSVSSKLGEDKGFARLRIGVGKPPEKSHVNSYLTSSPISEAVLVESMRMDLFSDDLLKKLLSGDFDKCMNVLHAGN
jgi:PTH1 family peptidyl-tRNA hydrolase